MPRLSADPVTITLADEQVLSRLVRAHGTPQKLSERAQMILLATGGTGVRQIARQLGVWPKTVRHWLHRGLTAAVTLPTAKTGATAVAQRLADAPRAGTPATFMPEQICAIIALACKQPAAESNLPPEPLEPRRTGPMCRRTGHRRWYLEQLGWALVARQSG